MNESTPAPLPPHLSILISSHLAISPSPFPCPSQYPISYPPFSFHGPTPSSFHGPPPHSPFPHPHSMGLHLISPFPFHGPPPHSPIPIPWVSTSFPHSHSMVLHLISPFPFYCIPHVVCFANLRYVAAQWSHARAVSVCGQPPPTKRDQSRHRIPARPCSSSSSQYCCLSNTPGMYIDT